MLTSFCLNLDRICLTYVPLLKDNGGKKSVLDTIISDILGIVASYEIEGVDENEREGLVELRIRYEVAEDSVL